MHTEVIRTHVTTRRSLAMSAPLIDGWRAARYREIGFLDAPTYPELASPDDWEIVATGRSDRVLATMALRSCGERLDHCLGLASRPRFRFEAVHGTALLDGVVDQLDLHDNAVGQVWEVGRFVRLDDSPACDAAATRCALEVARLTRRLHRRGRARLVVGEVESDLAGRGIDALGLDPVLGTPLTSAPIDGPFAPRYLGRTLVPFCIDLDSVTAEHVLFWERLAHGELVAA